VGDYPKLGLEGTQLCWVHTISTTTQTKHLLIWRQSEQCILNDILIHMFSLNILYTVTVGAKLQGWGQAAGYQPRPQAGG